MMSKSMKWGDELFLVHCERGKLQIQRVGVDVETKKVSLHLCNLSSDKEATFVLPVDARLVAANEVEDSVLAIRYPVLAFLSSQGARPSSSASDRRPQSIRNYEAAIDTNHAVMSSRSWLILYMLHQKESIDEIQWRLLKMVEVPTRAGDNDAAVSGKSADMLQVFVMDGPHVLLFELRSQHATLLDLQRTRQGNEAVGFIEALDVVHGMKDDAPEDFEVVACTYVSELHSNRSHILIHTRGLSSSDRSHTWSVVSLDCDQGGRISKRKASLCPYLPLFPSATGCNGPMSKLEQITCCCFILEMSQKHFIACDTTSWDVGSRFLCTPTSIGVSGLVITGTTSNTIYVHTNGILLVSYVLPSRPAEIWPLCEDDLDQSHVLCVRCDDENHSFFMLGFSSDVQHVSVELLLSFKHVGHAHNGKFAGTHASDRSTQVLLLNDVQGFFGLNGNMSIDGNKTGACKALDHKQLVKRSVLVSQKSSSPAIKLCCHRLRLHEGTKMKRGSRLRKRSRNNEDVSRDGPRAESCRYIERTQKVSFRDKSVNGFEPVKAGAVDTLTASCAQLDKLASSLSARLSNGLQELEHLQVIMIDKISLVHQLNQLIARLWQKLQARARYPSDERLLLLPSIPAQDIDSRYLGSQGGVDMETIVSATIAKLGSMKQASKSSLEDLTLAQQVSLEQFTVLEYVPSSSYIHAEVVLSNLSEFAFDDSYVVLTAPQGGQTSTQGWRCLSSVVANFPPARCMAEHTTSQQQEARFQLDFQFTPSYLFFRERKPLEAMLWLHWGSSQDDLIVNTTLALHLRESALAIASVKIYPKDLIVDGRLQTKVGSSWSGSRNAFTEQTQLLFISSGSNLVSWFRKMCFGIPASFDPVIRPTFALISINVSSRESMPFELSKVFADLPPDVYVMHNPFQHTHLRAVQRVLRSMRREILTTRHQDLQVKENVGKKRGTEDKHRERTQTAENRDPASKYRAMQSDTDLHASLFLHRLQRRVNFHSIWFDADTI